MRPRSTSKQRKRLEWLASATRWRRVGTEELQDEIVLVRVKRKPPLWRLEHYIELDGQPKKVVAIMEKAPKGERGWLVIVPNEEGEPHALRFRTKRQAILGFSKLEPLREEEAAA